MRTSLQRIGNSQGVIIPKPLLVQAGLTGEVDMVIERDVILLRKPRRAMREGWKEAAEALVAAQEDALIWPEFANEGDAEIVW